MSRRELSSFRWDGAQWTSFHIKSTTESLSSNSLSTTITADGTIRVATFNILADSFPWFIEMAIRSGDRFEWLCRAIIDLNPTIIGLNEVTLTALNQLQQCPFIRENYFITE